MAEDRQVPGSSGSPASQHWLRDRQHHYPLPGGVGPMTIAMRMADTVAAAIRAHKMKPPSF